MGQYYFVVNLDKRQYLHPHRLGDGLKLLEFGLSANGTMSALAILLASGNGRGGGDLHSNHPIIGSWAGDRVVIAGDYDDSGKFLEQEPAANLMAIANENYNAADDGYRAYLEALEERQAFDTPQEFLVSRMNLFGYVGHKASGYVDVSLDALVALCDDHYVDQEIIGDEAKILEQRFWLPEVRTAFLLKLNTWRSDPARTARA